MRRQGGECEPGKVHKAAPRIIREIRVDEGGALGVQVKETDAAIIGTNGAIFRAPEMQSVSQQEPHSKNGIPENFDELVKQGLVVESDGNPGSRVRRVPYRPGENYRIVQVPVRPKQVTAFERHGNPSKQYIIWQPTEQGIKMIARNSNGRR